MRILVISKFGYMRGGLERVMFDEIRWLRDAGHDVELFTTADARNEPSHLSTWFPRSYDYGAAARPDFAAVRDMFWNRAAASAVTEVIAEVEPDVVHCHGVHRHLSPSVLDAAQRAGVPLVLTAHDYFLVCPGNVLLRGGTTPCQPRRCGRRVFAAAAVHRCVDGSIARSVLGAAELTYQRLSRNYERTIRTVVCPSRFVADLLAQGGVDGPKLAVLPHAVAVTDARRAPTDGPFLVAGRVSPEKGISVALEAARRAGVPMVVAGDGPLLPELRTLYPEADWVGHLDAHDLSALLAKATALVVPSRSPENAPMSVLEAMAAGVPVIASRIGGIPEQVTDKSDGLLVPPGDHLALSAAMQRLWEDPGLAATLGAEARRTARERFAPAAHVTALLDIYHEAGAS